LLKSIATSLDAGATRYAVVKKLARLTWINHSWGRRDVAICDTTGAEIKSPEPLVMRLLDLNEAASKSAEIKGPLQKLTKFA